MTCSKHIPSRPSHLCASNAPSWSDRYFCVPPSRTDSKSSAYGNGNPLAGEGTGFHRHIRNMIECSRIVGLPDMDRRRCEPVCQGRIKIVTTDLFTELVPLIESARILATLYQRPYTQGKLAFETLCRYLIQNIQPEPITRVAPHIVLRSNLPLFIDRLPGSLESTTTA